MCFKKLILLGSLLTAAMNFSYLEGEIIYVEPRWTPGSCNSSCVALMKRRFEEVDGVAQVIMNPGASSARLDWVPGKPYSYYLVKRAMQSVGLGLLYHMKIAVRGTIHGSDNDVKLVSLGDNTTFYLISPISKTSPLYNARENIAARKLDSNIKQKLLATKQYHELVTIHGHLFQAHRSPPNYLVVEEVKIEKPANPKNAPPKQKNPSSRPKNEPSGPMDEYSQPVNIHTQ